MRYLLSLLGDMLVAFILFMCIFSALGLTAAGGFVLAWMIATFFPVAVTLVFKIILIICAVLAVLTGLALTARGKE